MIGHTVLSIRGGSEEAGYGESAEDGAVHAIQVLRDQGWSGRRIARELRIEEALTAALLDMERWTPDMIERHAEARPLFGVPAGPGQSPGSARRMKPVFCDFRNDNGRLLSQPDEGGAYVHENGHRTAGGTQAADPGPGAAGSDSSEPEHSPATRCSSNFGRTPTVDAAG